MNVNSQDGTNLSKKKKKDLCNEAAHVNVTLVCVSSYSEHQALIKLLESYVP